MAVLAVACFVTGRLGTELASLSVVSAIWPAAGVALAGLLLLGMRAWPGVAVGGFLEVMSNGVSAPVALGVAAGQTLAPVVAVGLLRTVGFNDRLIRLFDVLALVAIGGFASNVITATVGTSLLVSSGFLSGGDWPLAWFVWWVGDVIGVLTVAPLLLVLPRSAPVGPAPPRRRAETAVLLIGTAGASYLLFGSSLPLVFLVFPFTLWASLRHGVGITAAVNVVVAIVAVWTTVTGRGPFSDLPSTVRLVSLQAFNASVVITSLLLAALMNERRRALEDVRESRARIVEAADAERRRLEHDLHDGAQQRLMSLSYTLGLALSRLTPGESREVESTLKGAVEELRSAHAELRTLAHGIHPVVLTQHGLAGALNSLAEQAPLPVAVAASVPRYHPVVEATAYFIVCEALANVAKHARATTAMVNVQQHHARLVLEVADDGVGGADPALGSGLTGLRDRAAALGGHLAIRSPAGKGTRLRAELPCDWS